MASIRKRGNSYLLVVSMGYDPECPLPAKIDRKKVKKTE